ncbi:MAG: glutamate--tRNA ligase family protein [Planctomycetota bacterium]
MKDRPNSTISFAVRSRFAPTPSGSLHLGNARTFLANWILVKQAGGELMLRIDDIDAPRVIEGADVAACEDLRWLGLTWDGPAVYQSANTDAHQAAIAQLDNAGLLYRDQRQRRDLITAAAGQTALDHAPLDAGLHRAQTFDPAGPAPNLRFAIPDDPIEFHDAFVGHVRLDPRTELGDFIIRRRDGSPSYQLACVVDDHNAGINHIVRGDDLLASTGRQLTIHRALDLDPPTFTHLPLIVGRDGDKLSKRHGDQCLAAYRDNGIAAERVVALLSRWLGIDVGDEADAASLVERFELARVPREPIVFDEANDPLLR